MVRRCLIEGDLAQNTLPRISAEDKRFIILSLGLTSTKRENESWFGDV